MVSEGDTVNLRDVGANISGCEILPNRLFRSSQFYASSLQSNHIKAIVDLRRECAPCRSRCNAWSERVCPNWFIRFATEADGHTKMSSCAHCESNLKAQSADVTSKVYHLDLVTPGFKYRVFTSVPRETQLQAIGRILTFRSPEQVIAEKVADPKALGYTKLYVMFLEHSKKKIASVFSVLAQPESYPVLIHCIHGKDRTGMIVMLLLLLCEVDKDKIVSEYMISSRCMLAWQQHGTVKNKLDAHLQTAAVLSVEKEYIDAAIEHIEGVYEGVANYLLSCGVTMETQEAVKRLLMTESSKLVD